MAVIRQAMADPSVLDISSRRAGARIQTGETPTLLLLPDVVGNRFWVDTPQLVHDGRTHHSTGPHTTDLAHPCTAELCRRPSGQACPDQEIHLIFDNLSAHKTKAVDAFLDRHPNVTFHFTPTYSWWLNQVELWFPKAQRDVLARGIFTSTADLARKLRRISTPTRNRPSRFGGSIPTPPGGSGMVNVSLRSPLVDFAHSPGRREGRTPTPARRTRRGCSLS